VESILDEMYLPALYRRPAAFRKECYRKMKERMKVLTAEGIYHQLEEIRAKSNIHCVDDLLRSGETWEIR